MLSYTLSQSLKRHGIVFFFFLRERNAELGFWKLKLVLKCRLLCCCCPSLSMDPSHFLNHLVLLKACFARVAVTQRLSPLSSKSAGSMCSRVCGAVQTDCLSRFFFVVSHGAAGMAQRRHNQKVTRSQTLAWALPLISCSEIMQVT